MMKCAADLDRDLLAVNADLHSDPEELLLKKGFRPTLIIRFQHHFR